MFLMGWSASISFGQESYRCIADQQQKHPKHEYIIEYIKEDICALVSW